MSRINETLGLRPAGKRRIMDLPKKRADATKVTSAKCPKCGQHGATLSKTETGWLWCTWCYHRWALEPSEPTP